MSNDSTPIDAHDKSGIEDANAPAVGTRQSSVQRLVYTAEEVCEALSISQTTLWRLGVRRLLVPVPNLRHRLYSIRAVERFAETGGKG